ncbi:MAG TPA: hypothetical protein VF746_31315 [Longimicrobium sp.]|jgi:hypothetical protein
MATRDSRLLSWLVFLLGAGVLAAVVWARIAGTGTGWRGDLVGLPVGELPVTEMGGGDAEVTHPATIYFFETSCIPCGPATRELNRFSARRREGALPLFAITNSLAFSRDSALAFSRAVRTLRLRRSTPELRIVRELPLIVRTDARGRIVRAYVGIPGADALDVLGYPWQASATGR